MILTRLSYYITSIRNKEQNDNDFYNLVCNYTDYILQKPKLEMFIPCDINGKYIENKRPLQAYNKDHQEIDFAIEDSDYVLGGDKEYELALQKVLFRNWKLYCIVEDKVYIINDNDDIIYFNSKKECFKHIEGDDNDIRLYDIEYIIETDILLET